MYFLPSLALFSLFQSLLSVHDTVAQKRYDPELPPLPEVGDDSEEENSVKIIRLVKNKEPLVSHFLLLRFRAQHFTKVKQWYFLDQIMESLLATLNEFKEHFKVTHITSGL